MTTNLFVIANVKQLRADDSFKILLPFFRTSWGVGVLNSAIFNSFQNRVEFGTILEGFQNFGGGGFEHPPRYATGWDYGWALVNTAMNYFFLVIHVPCIFYYFVLLPTLRFQRL